jgi:molybdate transport system substrate-binding protein
MSMSSIRLMLSLWVLAPSVSAAEVRAAVAANFTAAMKEIATAFEEAGSNRVAVSYGSTGQLYAQIVNGAPFDVFLAADQRRPLLLVEKGLASDRFTYAIGKLALWSPDPSRVDDRGEVLRSGSFDRLAIANPKTAPYGAAAVAVLEKLGLHDALKPKLVRGQNIAQTYQFVATRNADLGFVAASQLVAEPRGSVFVIPQEWYVPIHQDAVMLRRGEDHAIAAAFLSFLRGEQARAIIAAYRYGLE